MTQSLGLIFALGLLCLGGCDAVRKNAPVSEPVTTDATSTLLKKSFPVTLSKIADGVWVHTSAYRVPGQAEIPSNGMIVEDGDSVILIDTAWGEMATYALMKAVESEIGKPVKSVVITHHHNDRVMGADVVEAMGAKIYTHPDVPARAFRLGLPVPNTSVAELKMPRSRTKVGAVEIAYPGPGHAEENLVVYIPRENILYAGCAVRGAGVTTLGNISDANLSVWPSSLNWVKETYPNTKQIVPGHGKGAAGFSLIDQTLGLIAQAVNAQTAPISAPASTTNPQP